VMVSNSPISITFNRSQLNI